MLLHFFMYEKYTLYYGTITILFVPYFRLIDISMNKKFVIALVIGCFGFLVLIACVGLGFVYFIVKDSPENNPNLSKKETSEYIIYYPEYYEKEAGYQAYHSTKNNSFEGRNNISLSEDENEFDAMEISSSQDCTQLAEKATEDVEKSTETYEADVSLDTSSISFNQSLKGVKSCYFYIEVNIEDDILVSESRVLENKAGDNRQTINIVYDEDTEEFEIEDLKDALQAFRLQ